MLSIRFHSVISHSLRVNYLGNLRDEPYFIKNVINENQHLSMLHVARIVFPPHSPWSDRGDEIHWRSTLYEHLYQGHWRKADYHQDNQSHRNRAKNHKSGRGRGTFNHKTNQGDWASTLYYRGHKSHWRQVSKKFENMECGSYLKLRFNEQTFSSF